MTRYDEQVFQSERIKPRSSRIAGEVPAAICEIRQMERNFASYGSREALFVAQAKHLADFTDDFQENFLAERHFNIYQFFLDNELRSYFTWRTKLRQGEVSFGCLSFAKLYVNELLNQIGCKDPNEAYAKLTLFQEQYGAINPEIIPDLTVWRRDFVIYHNLDASLLPKDAESEADQAYHILAHLDQYSPKEITQSLILVSDYNIQKSKVYKEKLADLEAVVSKTLNLLAAYYLKTYAKSTWLADYFGEMYTTPIDLFAQACFYDNLPKRTFDYVVGPNRVYHNIDGEWQMDFFYPLNVPKKRGTRLLRIIDSLLRKTYKFPPLNLKESSSYLLDLVKEAIKAKKQADQKITIDHKALAGIRQNASYTMDRLMTEEEAYHPEEALVKPEAQEKVAGDTDSGTPYNLNENELRYLKCLLEGSDKAWIRAAELMESILIDSINEKLFDVFNDTVLDESGLLEDYRADVAQIVQQG